MSGYLLKLLVFSWVIAATAAAMPADLLTVIPRDACAVVLVDAGGDRASAGEAADHAPGGATGLLSQLRSTGLLPAGGTAGIIADAATALSILRDYPFAVVLTDVRAKPKGEMSFQLANLQAALIVKTAGENGPLTRQIQSLLSSWTTEQTARVQRDESDGAAVYTLMDSRVPDWVRIRWARFGDYYVIALGEEAFEAVSLTIAGKGAPLSDDARFRKRHAKVSQPGAEIEWLFDAKRLRALLEETMPGRVAKAYRSLGINNSDHVLGSIGYSGRATTAAILHVSGESERLEPIAVPIADGATVAKAIPDEAKSCAIIAYPIQRLVRRTVDTYLASRRTSVQKRLRAGWSAFEQASGVRLWEDVLDRINPTIVVHDYPENPLGVAFLVTIVFEIRESPDEVHKAIDAMLAECRRRLNQPSEDGSERKGGMFAPRLHRDDDGVWFLQAGVYGPSLAVVDRWIVVSFSPHAVRQNVALLGGAAASDKKAAP